MCDKMNAEAGKCFELGCRYHMVADDITKFMNDRTIVNRILAAKYTCLFEILEKEETPLTYERIGVILKIGSKQAVEQLENRALKKLAKSMKHLEVYNEQDSYPHQGYVLFPELRRVRMSEWSYLPGACTWKRLNHTEASRDLFEPGEEAEGSDQEGEEGCAPDPDIDETI